MRVARDVPYRGNSEGEFLPNGVGQGYFAMGAAFVAVAVGSAGAAVLAMSLLSGDLPDPVPEREIIQSATASEAVATPVQQEEPIFKELIPTPVESIQLGTVALSMPQSKAAADMSGSTEPSVLQAGDPRFAHDASAARGLVDLEDGVETGVGESAFVPMTRPAKAPFDEIARDTPPEQPVEKVAAAVVPPPAKEPEKVQSSGKAPSGTALMTEDANIRTRPQKGSKIIGTVPASTQVQLVGCESWCEIIVKGKRGFVWGKFVQRGQARSKTRFTVSNVSAKANDADKPEVVPAKELAPHPDQNRIR